MFERFTELARRALFFSRAAATRRGSVGIELTHLAIGALQVIPPATWDGLGATQPLTTVAQALDTARPAFGRGELAHIPFGASTKRALHVAAALADRHQHRDIDVLHLIAAILTERDDEAARTLAAAGLREERLLTAVKDGQHPDEPARPWLRGSLLGAVDNPPIGHAQALRVVDRLFIETDRKNWDEVRALFVDTHITVDMSSLAGGGALLVTADDLIAGFRAGLHAGKTSHHMTSNYQVEIDEVQGITVTAHGYAWNHVAALPEGEQLWETWGTYRIGLTPTSAGWKIDLFAYYSRLTRGNDAVRRHTVS